MSLRKKKGERKRRTFYIMVYYLAVKKDIRKFTGKKIELEKNQPEWGNLYPEKQI